MSKPQYYSIRILYSLILDYSHENNYNKTVAYIPAYTENHKGKGIAMTKTTEELFHELRHTKNIVYYMEYNSSYFHSPDLPQYLKELLHRCKRRKSMVIRSSCLNPSYAYQIFSGLKHPTRDKFIAILIATKLPLEEIQKSLKLFGYASLYAKNKRDAYIIYAIGQQMNVMQCNILLSNHDEAALT